MTGSRLEFLTHQVLNDWITTWASFLMQENATETAGPCD
jgi:hypothetical protein